MEAAKNAINHLLGHGSNDENPAQDGYAQDGTQTHHATGDNTVSSHHATGGNTVSSHHTTSDNPVSTEQSATTTGSSNKDSTFHQDTTVQPDNSATSKPVAAAGSHEHHAPHTHSGAHTSDSDDSGLSKTKSPVDPALVGSPDANPKNTKMAGTGADGSHSAVFGLTPDGHTHGDTGHGATPVKPAHSTETTVGAQKDADTARDGGRASTTGGGVSEQMNRPEDETERKGLERTDPAPVGAGAGTDGGKPGAGGVGLQQGSGHVPEH